MDIMERIKERVCKEKRKRIILPESEDERILEACSLLLKENFVDVVLVGIKEEIQKRAQEKGFSLEGCEIIDPKKYSKMEALIDQYYEMRKHKNITREEAKEMVENDYPTFAAMLLEEGYVDGMVSGANHSTADTLRVALQIIKTPPDIKTASSFFLMDTNEKEYGEEGIFVYSDCGMVQNPTSKQLVEIAKASAKSFELLVEKEPIVAFLSHSTYGSSNCEDVWKVQKATKMAKEEMPNVCLDGELQFDAAIHAEIGMKKAPGSPVAGRANVLIFPDLDAGNIAYKITERMGHAKAYGPITQGLKKPINDLSRGCSALDIVGVVAITALQAK